MTLAEQLKFFGKTQQQFAFDVGVGLATVNRWVNLKVHPSKLAIKRINLVLKEYENARQEKGESNDGNINWPSTS
jgi:hypothetical protein